MSDTQEALQEQALCRLMADPDIWYADRGSEAHKVAKSICSECPVRNPCLERGLSEGERFGIWGGADREDRGAILRRKKHRSRSN